MSYKLIILAPSTGGKSTLTRNLREHAGLHIAETDEEVMKANNNTWPDDKLKNEVLVPQTTKEIISLGSVIYFASYLPDNMIIQARDKGFKIILLKLNLDVLIQRNNERMNVENYQDATPWFKMQLDNFNHLYAKGLIDITIDGEQSVEKLTKQIADLAAE